MNCTYYGDFRVNNFKKRRMMGSQKLRAIDAMLTQRIDPSVYIRNQARHLMNEGILYLNLLIILHYWYRYIVN